MKHARDLAAVAASLMGAAFFLQLSLAPQHPTIPKCQEDEIIQGTGDFHHGRWTAYHCQHPDNITHTGYIPPLPPCTGMQQPPPPKEGVSLYVPETPGQNCEKRPPT